MTRRLRVRVGEWIAARTRRLLAVRRRTAGGRAQTPARPLGPEPRTPRPITPGLPPDEFPQPGEPTMDLLE